MSEEQKQRILIVEDEKPMARALELKFSDSGFEAKAVHDGQQALDALDSEAFDVILLDLIMPVMDGFAVLEQLQQKGNTVPVLVSTNLSQPEDAERAKALGASDYFVKSDTPIAEVVRHVEQALGTHS
ncbi:MAG: response regulator [Candidatus Andersenbacteria bacterium]|nr:response regulator [Candidatus Andersenbacteria bacterium]